MIAWTFPSLPHQPSVELMASSKLMHRGGEKYITYHPKPVHRWGCCPDGVAPVMARETVQNGAKFHRVILAWMDDSNVLYFCVLAWRDECELYRRSPMRPYLLFGYDEVRRVWCSVCIRQRRRKGMPGTYTGTGTHRGGVEPPREAVGRKVGLRMVGLEKI